MFGVLISGISSLYILDNSLIFLMYHLFFKMYAFTHFLREHFHDHGKYKKKNNKLGTKQFVQSAEKLRPLVTPLFTCCFSDFEYHFQ